jgi:hypothetical protein
MCGVDKQISLALISSTRDLLMTIRGRSSHVIARVCPRVKRIEKSTSEAMSGREASGNPHQSISRWARTVIYQSMGKLTDPSNFCWLVNRQRETKTMNQPFNDFLRNQNIYALPARIPPSRAKFLCVFALNWKI